MLEYNTKKPALRIPEYGRCIHKMVDYVVNVKDREKRNKLAKAVIDIMGNINPHLRDVADFKHKLWDQLFIMSNFKMEVDSPYKKPSKEILDVKPKILNNRQGNLIDSKTRLYGNNILLFISKIIEEKDWKSNKPLILVLVNHMKKHFHREKVSISTIANHIFHISKGKMDIRDQIEDIEKIYSKESIPKK